MRHLEDDTSRDTSTLLWSAQLRQKVAPHWDTNPASFSTPIPFQGHSFRFWPWLRFFYALKSRQAPSGRYQTTYNEICSKIKRNLLASHKMIVWPRAFYQSKQPSALQTGLIKHDFLMIPFRVLCMLTILGLDLTDNGPANTFRAL